MYGRCQCFCPVNRCSLALAVKVQPEVRAHFTSLKAEKSLEFNPPTCRARVVCVCVLCRKVASWGGCPSFLQYFLFSSWKWLRGRMQYVLGALLQRPKALCFSILASAPSRSAPLSSPSPYSQLWARSRPACFASFYNAKLVLYLPLRGL